MNGGLSIYYGMGMMFMGIMGFVVIGVWLYKVFTGEKDFSWGTLIGMTSVMGILGTLGYLLLRAGYEEMER